MFKSNEQEATINQSEWITKYGLVPPKAKFAVMGAGTKLVNGYYEENGIHNHKPKYRQINTNGIVVLHNGKPIEICCGGGWCMGIWICADKGWVYDINQDINPFLPPKDGWNVTNNGVAPFPTINFLGNTSQEIATITTIATNESIVKLTDIKSSYVSELKQKHLRMCNSIKHKLETTTPGGSTRLDLRINQYSRNLTSRPDIYRDFEQFLIYIEMDRRLNVTDCGPECYIPKGKQLLQKWDNDPGYNTWKTGSVEYKDWTEKMKRLDLININFNAPGGWAAREKHTIICLKCKNLNFKCNDGSHLKSYFRVFDAMKQLIAEDALLKVTECGPTCSILSSKRILNEMEKDINYQQWVQAIQTAAERKNLMSGVRKIPVPIRTRPAQKKSNNTCIPLRAGCSYEGSFEKNSNDYPTLQINVWSDKDCSIRIQQAPNTINVVNDDIYEYSIPTKALIFQQTLAMDYFRVIVTNTSNEAMKYLRITVKPINSPAIKQGCIL